MNEQTVNGQAEVMDTRPPLDAIAEDLVATKPEPTPKPKPKAKPKAEAKPEPELEPASEPTPEDAVVEETAAGEDLTPENDEPDTPPDEGEPSAYDFMDDLTGGEDPADDQPASEDDGRLVRVKVDGEEKEVTISDLKKAYSAEGAIDKRLQEATEARNAAQTEMAPLVATVRAMHDRLAHVYEHYNQVMFTPQVEMPDPSLIETDPILYNRQQALWQQDQARIQHEQAQMQQTLQATQQIYDEQQKEVLKTEKEALLRRMPGLKKPTVAKAFRERIAKVAADHGFTTEEVAMAADHRLLTLAAEAAAYRELKSKLAAPKPQATTKRRTMPAKGDNRQHQSSRKANQQRRLKDKARNSGSVDDVALTLLI